MKRKAFTLLEIAMAICIIAVAGIFAVQMISRISDARGLVAQIQKYDQSIAAFHNKYQALPGANNAIARKIGISLESA